MSCRLQQSTIPTTKAAAISAPRLAGLRQADVVGEEGAGGRGIEPVAGRQGGAGAGAVPVDAFGDDRAPKELRRPGIAGTRRSVVDCREVEGGGRERVEGLGGYPAGAGRVGVWLGVTSSDEECRDAVADLEKRCLLYTSPSPRDRQKSRMPSSA